MSVTWTVKKTAADPKGGMTLAELAAFVQDAMRQDVPPDAVVKQRATWHGTIRALEVRAGDADV